MKVKTYLKIMKNSGAKSKILLDQKLITLTTMIENIRISNLLQMMICLWKKTGVFREDNKYYPQIFLNECLYKL